jgi:hypothetical protein
MIKRSMTTGMITGLLASCGLFLVLEPQVASAQTLRDACKADAAKICPGVKVEGGQLGDCLKQHKNDLSTGCAKALEAQAKTGK